MFMLLVNMNFDASFVIWLKFCCTAILLVKGNVCPVLTWKYNHSAESKNT